MPLRIVSPLEYSKTIDECFPRVRARKAARRHALVKFAVRDAAMISLAYICGLKTGEIAGLSRQDYDDVTKVLTVQGTSARRLTLPGFAGNVLNYWCSNYVGSAGPMFYGITKLNQKRSQSLSRRSVEEAVRDRFDKAGCGFRSPADLRRSFKALLVQAKVPSKVSKALLGLASRVTDPRRQASQAAMDAALVDVSLLAPAYVAFGRVTIGP